jgi:hypothetical protein
MKVKKKKPEIIFALGGFKVGPAIAIVGIIVNGWLKKIKYYFKIILKY